MTLSEQLAEDMKTAMRAKDAQKLSVLRMLKTAIGNWELAQGKSAGDEEILKLITTQVKQRKDAAEQFRTGARPEMAAQEDAESMILMAYLPEQLSEDEVHRIVLETVTETAATGPADLGKVMGALMPKLKGRADGGLVNRLVKEALSA